MKTSTKGIRLIKACEGLRLEPYLCPAGVPTIGYGSTHGVSMDMGSITQETADSLLAADIRNEAEKYLDRFILVDVNQHQYDALSSLCFNIGAGNFRSSTLLAKLNKGDYEGCAKEFWKWRRGGGKVLPGLVKRRQMEEDLFRLSVPDEQLHSPGPKSRKLFLYCHLSAVYCSLVTWRLY